MLINRAIITALIVLSGWLAIKFLNSPESILPRSSLEQFPKEIGIWKGRESRFSDDVYQVLGVDDSFLATYRENQGRQVQLYIGYYQSQREGELIHSPKNCMPGAGWSILETSTAQVRYNPQSPEKKDVIQLLIGRGKDRMIVLYWFHSRGRMIASEYMQKVYLVIDAITKHRTDGSFVRLIAPLQNSDVESTSKYLVEFAEQLIPRLEPYIPS